MTSPMGGRWESRSAGLITRHESATERLTSPSLPVPSTRKASMAIVSLYDPYLSVGTPVKVDGLTRGPYFYAGHRRSERSGEEWLEVFNRNNDRIAVALGTVTPLKPS